MEEFEIADYAIDFGVDYSLYDIQDLDGFQDFAISDDGGNTAGLSVGWAGADPFQAEFGVDAWDGGSSVSGEIILIA